MPEHRPAHDLISEFLAPVADADLVMVVSQDAFSDTVEALIAADGETLFEVPSGGFVGDMAGPWVGPEGYLAGWTEWLSSWDEFRVQTDQLLDCGNGHILQLATTRARPKGSPSVLEQRAGALYHVGKGQIVRIEHFLDEAQARQAAGLEDTE